MTFWKRQNYKNRKKITGCQGQEGEEDLTRKEHVSILGGDETLLYPDFCHGYTNVCVKMHRTVQAHFSSFKLHYCEKQTERGWKDQQSLVLARTEQLELSYGIGWNRHRTGTLESNLTVPYKIKHAFPMGPCDCSLVYLPQKNENMSTQCSKHFYLL